MPGAEVSFDLIKPTQPGLGELAMSHLVPLSEFNHIGAIHPELIQKSMECPHRIADSGAVGVRVT